MPKKIHNILFKTIMQNHDERDYKYSLAAAVKPKIGGMSIGTNTSKTHPHSRQFEGNILTDWYRVNTHAEIRALLNAINKSKGNVDRLIGARMWILRAKRDGSMAMAKPCSRCQSVMRMYGIGRISYSTENGMKEMRLQ